MQTLAHLPHMFAAWLFHTLADFSQRIEALGTLGKLIAAIVTAAGVAYAAQTFRRGRAWRQGDLAASLMRQLETDEELAFACQALDWGVGPIAIPQKHRALARHLHAADDAVLDHAPLVLAQAMEPQLNPGTLKSAAGMIYRHSFIRLFNHLENVGRMVKTGQVRIDDLDGLDYWLKQIAAYAYIPEHQRGEIPANTIFQPALATFGYHLIPELGERLGVSGWKIYRECVAHRESKLTRSMASEAESRAGV